MKKIIFLLLPLLSGYCFAKEGKSLDAKDYILKSCLLLNYSKIDKNDVMINDRSILSEKYSPDDWDRIIKFTEDNVGDFYKDKIYFHIEEKGEVERNIIFAKCIEFYHSDKLRKFIKKYQY